MKSRIFAVCDRFNVPVVVDAAEAMGARYKRTGDSGRETEDGGQRTEDRHNSVNVPNDLNELNDPNAPCWIHAGKGAKAAVFSFNGNKIMTTSAIFDNGLCLPSGTAMTDSDIERVVETVIKCGKY